MERPTDSEKCLAILGLRVIGLSQDSVASIVHCHKITAADTEKWFAQLPYKEATIFCDDQAIKRMVGRDLVSFEQASKDVLVKAAQVTADDILRHYRSDYTEQRVKARPYRAFEKHWHDLAEVASALASNFSKVRLYSNTKVFSDAKVLGNVIDGGSIWLDTQPLPSCFSESDRDDPGALEKIDAYFAMRLLEHLKQESSLFSEINDWREVTTESISEELMGKLLFVAHGGAFDETTCKICKPWYQ